MPIKNPQKIGILGGAFNPPHWGHFLIAEFVLNRLNLNKIIFIPSAKPALKNKDVASVKDRLAMTKFLIKPEPRFSVSEIEIKRAKKDKKSYTFDTIKELKKIYPNDKLNWIIGEDSLTEIIKDKWYKGIELFNMIDFIVTKRPGYDLKINRLPTKFKKIAEEKLLALRRRLRQGEPKIKKINFGIAVSSTEIRRRIKCGEKFEDLLPKNISDYIKRKKIYGFGKK